MHGRTSQLNFFLNVLKYIWDCVQNTRMFQLGQRSFSRYKISTSNSQDISLLFFSFILLSHIPCHLPYCSQHTSILLVTPLALMRPNKPCYHSQMVKHFQATISTSVLSLVRFRCSCHPQHQNISCGFICFVFRYSLHPK